MTESFTFDETAGGTWLGQSGELGTDLWRLGQAWGDLVARSWVDVVRDSMAAIKTESERRVQGQSHPPLAIRPQQTLSDGGRTTLLSAPLRYPPAQDTAGIAALAGGRLTVLGIIGSMDSEFTEFGLDPDLKARGRALDERLARVQAHCSSSGTCPPSSPLLRAAVYSPELRQSARSIRNEVSGVSRLLSAASNMRRRLTDDF